MTRDEIAREVLAAVDRGDIPRGGPSEAVARDMLATIPAGYWPRWSDDAADRIRRVFGQGRHGHCAVEDFSPRSPEARGKGAETR